MSELARETIRAIHEAAIDHYARAKTRAEGNHHKIFHALGTAIDHFADCGCLGIVGDYDFGVEMSAQKVCQHHLALPRQIGRHLYRATVKIAIRYAHADATQRVFAAFDEDVLNAGYQGVDVIIKHHILLRGERCLGDDCSVVSYGSNYGVGAAYVDTYRNVFHVCNYNVWE